MIVWSLSVIVTYLDGSWSSSSLTYDKSGLQSVGPDISSIPEIKQLVSSLGFTPVSGQSDLNITNVVFRFSVLTTNGHINVLGDTDKIEIISNNQTEVTNALSDNIEFTSNLTLSDWASGILLALNENYEQVTDLIPNKYCFYDDVTTIYDEESDTHTPTYRGINDGGDDMYDGANYLNTNLTQLYDTVKESQSDDGAEKSLASIIYTHTMADNEDDDEEYFNPPMDGVVEPGDNYFGESSKYFTNLYPGLFVLVADNMNITEFSITGNVGSDGDGVNAVAISPVGTANWTMFFKSNHDEENEDPTINHIILIPGTSEGLSQQYDDGAEHDDHAIFGLSDRRRMIYALVATQPEAGPITTEEAVAIAAKIIELVPGT